jgi:hypothetical protein
VLLLSDFGNGIGTVLGRGVTVTNLLSGMRPSPNHRNIARTQLYFVDACRDQPSAFDKFETVSTTPVWDPERDVSDEPFAPVFFAAMPGELAYSIRGKQTIFSQALLDSLQGGAARECGFDAHGLPRWGVTIDSLRSNFEYHLTMINRRAGTEAGFNVVGGGSGDHRVIHWLDDTPWVRVTLEIDPKRACPHTSVTIVDADDDDKPPNWDLPRVTPHPYHGRLLAGAYRAIARIDASVDGLVGATKHFEAVPPSRSLRMQVSAREL